MGESKGGGGGERSSTTGNIARGVAASLTSQNRQVEEVHVQWLTGDLYACDVSVFGEPEKERFFIRGRDVSDNK